jgi:hypothetical protein
LAEVEKVADQRLGELRRDNPGEQYDGYRIWDTTGCVIFRSWDR